MPTNHDQRVCAAKVLYVTRKEALTALRRIDTSAGNKGIRQAVYACPCLDDRGHEHYHLGTQRSRKERRAWAKRGYAQ